MVSSSVKFEKHYKKRAKNPEIVKLINSMRKLILRVVKSLERNRKMNMISKMKYLN